MEELKYYFQNELTNTAKFCIFISRYLPYFYYICISCLYYSFNNPLTSYSIIILVCSAIIFCITTFSLFGTIQIFKNIEKWQNNGNNFKLIDIKKQDIKKAYQILILNIILIIFGLTYPVVSAILTPVSVFYISYKTKLKSNSLLKMNPFLRLFFNVYDVKFKINENTYKELVIAKNKINEKSENIKLYDAGFLWYVK